MTETAVGDSDVWVSAASGQALAVLQPDTTHAAGGVSLSYL